MLVFLSYLIAFSLWLFSCTAQQLKPVVLTVSAAGVYRDVLAEVDKLYKQEKPNVTITYNIAGSGFLRKQIEQGVPADIFLSGLEKEMDALENKGLILPETRHLTLLLMKSRQSFTLITCSILLCIWLFSCTLQQAKLVTLTVSAASVFKNVMPEIDKLYKQERPSITITYNFAGGGVLKKQIEQGAPVDIYLPASSKSMNSLQEENFVIPETRQDLLENEIVLIASKDFTAVSDFKDLTNTQVKRVALGTEGLDAGIYAKEILTSLKIYNQIKPKGVFEEQDVRQILKYVEAKKVDVGITFLTEAKRSDKVRIVAVSPEGFHTPIISPIAVLKSCKDVPEAEAFIKFLKSDKAVSVFEKYGFMMIK